MFSTPNAKRMKRSIDKATQDYLEGYIDASAKRRYPGLNAFFKEGLPKQHGTEQYKKTIYMASQELKRSWGEDPGNYAGRMVFRRASNSVSVDPALIPPSMVPLFQSDFLNASSCVRNYDHTLMTLETLRGTFQALNQLSGYITFLNTGILGRGPGDERSIQTVQRALQSSTDLLYDANLLFDLINRSGQGAAGAFNLAGLIGTTFEGIVAYSPSPGLMSSGDPMGTGLLRSVIGSMSTQGESIDLLYLGSGDAYRPGGDRTAGGAIPDCNVTVCFPVDMLDEEIGDPVEQAVKGAVENHVSLHHELRCYLIASNFAGKGIQLKVAFSYLPPKGMLAKQLYAVKAQNVRNPRPGENSEYMTNEAAVLYLFSIKGSGRDASTSAIRPNISFSPDRSYVQVKNIEIRNRDRCKGWIAGDAACHHGTMQPRPMPPKWTPTEFSMLPPLLSLPLC